MTKDEALKLALEALEEIADEVFSPYDNKLGGAILAIREALAQPETVSPGGGLVPAVPVAVYGYCPVCGGAGVMRERRPNGDDKCTNGHKYPSSKALAQPEQEPVALPEKMYEFVPTPEPVKWHHPECEGECIACLIERVVQQAYGSQGLAYLQRHLVSQPQPEQEPFGYFRYDLRLDAWVQNREGQRPGTPFYNTPPQSFMSWQEGYEAGRQAERNRMVAYMKQMFDAYSLSSDPSQLKNRSNT